MPRSLITPIIGEKYHVYNRGVEKRIIFHDKTDYLRFYQCMMYFNQGGAQQNYRLAKLSYKKPHQSIVAIHAYCLLPNHFHLILEPVVENGVTEFMRKLGGGYTSYFNTRNKRSGVLFQGSYKRKHVSNDEYFRYLFAYVNENHYVHSLPAPTSIYETSSLHYSGRTKSNALIETTIIDSYNQAQAILLAKEIYERRLQYKDWYLDVE